MSFSVQFATKNDRCDQIYELPIKAFLIESHKFDQHADPNWWQNGFTAVDEKSNDRHACLKDNKEKTNIFFKEFFLWFISNQQVMT